MGEKPKTQTPPTENPEDKDLKPLTPEPPKPGTEEEPPSLPNPPSGPALSPEEEEELKQLREIKRTTGFTKFTESAKEAQRLLKRNEELEEKLAKASETSLDKELKGKNPDWEFMSDAEKENARKILKQEKDIALLKEKEAWKEDFSGIVKKEEFSELKDREEEFKEFCYKYPKSMDIETLAKSFLYKKPEEEPKKPLEERKGLEAPSGGSPEIAPSSEMSLEDVERLRTTQPKKYIELIKSGRIKKVPEK